MCSGTAASTLHKHVNDANLGDALLPRGGDIVHKQESRLILSALTDITYLLGQRVRHLLIEPKLRATGVTLSLVAHCKTGPGFASQLGSSVQEMAHLQGMAI